MIWGHRHDLGRVLARQSLNPPDWMAFLRFCQSHRLLGFVYFRLRQAGQPLPEEADAFGRRALFLQGRENQRRISFLARLGELLEEPPALDFMLLKGPYLADRFFGGLQCRHLGDIDLMVHPSQVDAAGLRLQKAGLVCRTRRPLGRHFLHALEYAGQDHSLDLHWCLRAWPFVRLDLKGFWERSRRFSLADTSYRVPADEDCLLLHLLGLHDDLGRGEASLKQAVDLYQMLGHLDPVMDWAGFFARRRGEGWQRSCQLLLLAVNEWLGTGQPFERLHQAVSGVVLSGELHWQELSRLPGWRSRWLWGRLFDAPWPIPMLWWLVSLPFRTYAHR